MGYPVRSRVDDLHRLVAEVVIRLHPRSAELKELIRAVSVVCSSKNPEKVVIGSGAKNSNSRSGPTRPCVPTSYPNGVGGSSVVVSETRCAISPGEILPSLIKTPSIASSTQTHDRLPWRACSTSSANRRQRLSASVSSVISSSGCFTVMTRCYGPHLRRNC